MTNIKHFNTIDLTGKKFGRLLVKKLFGVRGNRGQIKWECVCDCGNKHTVTGESLRGGKSKSCGCLRKESPPNKVKDRKLAIWKHLYDTIIQKRSRRYGIKVDLSLDDFIFFSKEPCYYCGLKNSNLAHDRIGRNKNKQVSNTKIKFNGIERVDSSKGYWNDNVVTCCKYCDAAKNTMSEQEFIHYVKRLYEHFRINHRI